MRKINITAGEKYGRLTVVERVAADPKSGNLRYLCKCDCGVTSFVTGSNLSRGVTTSCGCLARETTIKRNTTHGKCGTRLYTIWCGIRERCSTPGQESYKNYGGRGIRVEFKGFEDFYDWAVRSGYSDKLSIDRIDNNGNYSERNCKWSTRKEQNNNQRSNALFTHDSKTMNMKQWAESVGLPYKALQHRVYRGWDFSVAITTPLRSNRGVT